MPEIDEALVRRLIAQQFPQWRDLRVERVVPGGHDNRTFRLGDELSVRMPSDVVYTAQLAYEHRWLPYLAQRLPLPIPAPVAMGEPGAGYPWPWAVYRWIEGTPLGDAPPRDEAQLARALARFLKALQAIDCAEGPAAGPQNFYRGGDLRVYDAETRAALSKIGDGLGIVPGLLLAFWERALASRWENAPVWVHGDVAQGNLLMREGQLAAVIDFGAMATGDPACDLVIAYTYFSEKGREAFRAAMQLDCDTWSRARGWALWKALIVYAAAMEKDAGQMAASQRVIETIVKDG